MVDTLSSMCQRHRFRKQLWFLLTRSHTTGCGRNRPAGQDHSRAHDGAHRLGCARFLLTLSHSTGCGRNRPAGPDHSRAHDGAHRLRCASATWFGRSGAICRQAPGRGENPRGDQGRKSRKLYGSHHKSTFKNELRSRP